MKRPLGSVALLFVAGILLGRWIQMSPEPLFAVSFSLVVPALIWPRARLWALSLFLICAGWTDLVWHTAVISPNDVRTLAGNDTQSAVVRGTLHAAPVPRIFEWQGREQWHSSVEIDLREIRIQERWEPAVGKIVAFAPGILSSNYFAGQVVEVPGILALPPGPRAEGLFDARAYYGQLGIYYQLRTESENSWIIPAHGPPRTPPFSDRFTAWARRQLALGLNQEDEALRLIWTLALDWKAPLTDSVEEPFMRAGTYHIFAVDGLRIGLLAGIILAMLRALRLPRFVCGLLAIPVIWFYAGITGWPASAVRAAVMMTVIIGGWIGRRPTDLLNSLAGAAFVILLWDPAQLFQAGFQLSFLVVLSIALVLPLIRNLFHGWIFKKDPFLPDALQPRWPAPLHKAALFIIDTCAVSLAAWLGSIPLAAAYFHLFTPVSVPANIIVVPITALALVSIIGSLLTAPIFPAVAILFNNASWFFMKAIIAVSNVSAHWQPGSFNVSAPLPVTFALYYLVLFSFLTGWIFRSKFKWLTVGAIVSLSCVWLFQRAAANRSVAVYLFPLDGGSAVYTDKLLFDCGNTQLTETIMKPFLRAHGINRLDAMALTAGHTQQAGGAMIILTNFPPRRTLLNPSTDRSPSYREVVRQIQKTAQWRALISGDTLSDWSVLHPEPSENFPEADDNALVFTGNIKGHSIVLLSTLGRSGQDSLTEHHPDLRADILITGLPARDEPLCSPLLDLIQPKLIVVIDSQFPAMRRASPKLKQRLAARRVPVVYCRETGSLKLLFSDQGWTLLDATGATIEPH